jgi:hypothetical protein
LEAGVKVLDSADLDFSRYADTLFEVLFAGGRLATGGNLAVEQKEKLSTNVLLGTNVSVVIHHATTSKSSGKRDLAATAAATCT